MRASGPGHHAARFSGGVLGVLQGTRTFVLQDAAGNIEKTHSISAGLDYAAVGPEHASRSRPGRVLTGFRRRGGGGVPPVGSLEGILPALESAHAVAYACRMAARSDPSQIVLINLSGRGDKDVQTLAARWGGDDVSA